tara:strand:+ start:281 stop:598 length:318 start_codon:yes stop_codon:yes gene_type:complete
MKRIIDGRTYNTGTAEKICDTGNDEYSTDFRYENSALYITKKGAYFIAGDGGALSRFSAAKGNGYGGGAGIIVLSRSKAFAEVQRCAGYDADLISEYFGDMVEEA